MLIYFRNGDAFKLDVLTQLMDEVKSSIKELVKIGAGQGQKLIIILNPENHCTFICELISILL